MGPQLASAVGTAGITIAVLFIVGLGIGFWLITKRKARGDRQDPLATLAQRANILLVRVDDAVKSAEDELGFAVAQFGDDRAKEFEAVLAQATSQLAEAFGLQQKLDDATLDSQMQRREWTARIIHLCERAQAELAAHERSFAELRRDERSAPADVAVVTDLIAAVESGRAEAVATLKTLGSEYARTAVAAVADNIDRADAELQGARDAVSAAQQRLTAASSETPDGGSASTAAEHIRAAQEHARRAQQLLDAIATAQRELARAAEAVTVLRASTHDNLAEARALRDAPPDAESSSVVAAAIQTVEAALSAKDPLIDPLASLEILRTANAELDGSMATARNQQRRLDGARTALAGALVAARSQLATTRDFITTRRGGVGAEARTRIAEAERLLRIAEAEADPVAALDAARSSATYSRDADALARFDLLHAR